MNVILAILLIVAIAKILLIAGFLSIAWRAYRRALSYGYGYAWRQGVMRIATGVAAVFTVYDVIMFSRGGFTFGALWIAFLAPAVVVTLILAAIFTVVTAVATRI